MTHHLTSETSGPGAGPMLTDLKVLTGAGAILSAAHRSRNGQMHGHTWEVTAWWTGDPDATERQQALSKYLSIFDHQVLADGVAWAESLAKAILIGMDCERVEISRPLERLYAVAERTRAIIATSGGTDAA